MMSRVGTTVIRRGLVLGAVGWAATLFLPGLAVGRPRSTAAYLSAAVVYAAGAVVCHQRPDRSFHLRGVQMPVCARCTGIYLGAAVAALWACRARSSSRVGLSRNAVRWALVLGALPSLATLVPEWAGAAAVSNSTRAWAGAALGAAVAWIILAHGTSMFGVEVN